MNPQTPAGGHDSRGGPHYAPEREVSPVPPAGIAPTVPVPPAGDDERGPA